jgi:hypothetical protein
MCHVAVVIRKRVPKDRRIKSQRKRNEGQQ